jgi:chromosomal replication initiator protein
MRMDARFTFDRLVVGGANRLAVSAARAVAEAPGTTCNPLVIHGGSGLGKTHLLTATAHLLAALQPQAEIVALSMDEFSEQFHAAVGTGEAAAFAHRLACVDLLLLDDLQFLAGRRETQDGLLRLFTVMQATDRQIVCASDRLPREIADVDERLIARLASGLIVDVGMPEYEARVAILRAACLERQLLVPDDRLETLARRSVSSVRALQGLLNQPIEDSLGDGRAPVATPRRAVDALEPSSEFLSFLSDVAAVVEEQVATWQVRLREAIAYWKGEGYRTAVLERALALPTEPDVQGLVATYVQAVEHLRALEAEAMAVERALGGHELFRDPERLGEAEDLVERAMAGDLPPRAAAANASGVPPAAAVASAGDPTFLDRERVVWEWPDVSGRLIDELH